MLRDDFIGFSLNDIHSSDLGLYRVSDGSRYSDSLLPSLTDKTITVPGGDGTYYFGTQYTAKQFTIAIAYDNMSAVQWKQLRELMAKKEMLKLVFDEEPYKYYLVKSTGAPVMKYVAFDKEKDDEYFDENNLNSFKGKDQLYGQNLPEFSSIIYKGEGTLNFIAFNPYAVSTAKYLDKFDESNLREWKKLYPFILSTTKKTINNIEYTIDIPKNTGVLVYNPTNLATDFSLSLLVGSTSFPSLTVKLDLNHQISLESFNLFTGDAGICINTKLHLIEGVNAQGNRTGTLYNRYIKSGDFFKIENTLEPQLITFASLQEYSFTENSSIQYSYLYY